MKPMNQNRGPLIEGSVGRRRRWFVIFLLGIAGCTLKSSKEDVGSRAEALDSAPTLEGFAVYAERSVSLATQVRVVNGDVGVRAANSSELLVPGFEIAVASMALIDASRGTLADSVKLSALATTGVVHTNQLIAATGATYGTVVPFGAMPTLPMLAAVAPGSTAVTVPAAGFASLNPGAYGIISVKANGTLRLSSGEFAAVAVALGAGAKLEAQGPVDLHIAGRLDAGAQSKIRFAPSTTLTASAFHINVAGINGSSGALGATPVAAALGSQAEVRALLFAPGGTLSVGPQASIVGALCAREVSLGAQVSITREGGLGTDACAASCDDQNDCTMETCVAGSCRHAPVADGGGCSDGDACTRSDACQGGACIGNDPVGCSPADACHLAGSCDPTTGACSNPMREDGSSCADSDVCNGEETCAAGVCSPGTPLVLDDGDPCTADTCDANAGISHIPTIDGGCSDGAYDNLPPVEVSNGSATVGPAGGHVQFADTITLDVPAGALSADTTIRARIIEPPPELVELGNLVAPVIELLPSGLQFEVPVRLTIDMPPPGLGHITVVSGEVGDDEFDVLPIVASSQGKLEARLSHFSVVAIFSGCILCVAAVSPPGSVGAALLDIAQDPNCSTAKVRGVSYDILEELLTLQPGGLEFLGVLSADPLGAGSSGTWLQPVVARALEAALRDASAPSSRLLITSGWRSIAQQLALASCGNVFFTAKPGSNSHHAAGRAIDAIIQGSTLSRTERIDQCNSARTQPAPPATISSVLEATNPGWGALLETNGIQWFGTQFGPSLPQKMCNDPVHFDGRNLSAIDFGDAPVRAFQQIWNRFHPCRAIEENGTWNGNEETQDALLYSPATGFPSEPPMLPGAGLARESPPSPPTDVWDEDCPEDNPRCCPSFVREGLGYCSSRCGIGTFSAGVRHFDRQSGREQRAELVVDFVPSMTRTVSIPQAAASFILEPLGTPGEYSLSVSLESTGDYEGGVGIELNSVEVLDAAGSCLAGRADAFTWPETHCQADISENTFPNPYEGSHSANCSVLLFPRDNGLTVQIYGSSGSSGALGPPGTRCGFSASVRLVE